MIDPRDSNVIYAVADRCQGVYKSTDGAHTFAALTNDSGANESCTEGLLIDPLDPDRLYKPWLHGKEWGFDRSDDGGRTWASFPFVEAPRRGSIAVSGSQRYAVGSIDYAVLLTSADGITWSRVSDSGIYDPGVYTRQFFDVAADPVSGRIFLATSSGVYRRDPGGDFVKSQATAVESVNTIFYDTPTAALIIGTDFGLLRSTASPYDSWTDLHALNSAMPMTELVADPSNGDVYARSRMHVFRSRDFGRSWQTFGEPLSHENTGIAVDAGHDLYAFYNEQDGYAQIQKLATDGRWTNLKPAAQVRGIVADPLTPGTLYVLRERGFDRTRDGGATWEGIDPFGNFVFIGPLVINPRNSSILTAGAGTNIFKSTDAGKTWSMTTTPLVLVWFMPAPSNPDVLYGIVQIESPQFHTIPARSDDGGRTWSILPQPAPGDSVSDAAIDPHDPNRVFFVTLKHSIFRSSDGGRSWQSVSEGLPDDPIVAIAIDSAGAFVQVATKTRGVWELPLVSRQRAVRIW